MRERVRPLAARGGADAASDAARRRHLRAALRLPVRLEKQLGGTAWRLVGTARRAARCATSRAPFPAAANPRSPSPSPTRCSRARCSSATTSRDMDQVAEILERDFSRVYRNARPTSARVRPILSPERSLGSVIKLLTPSPEYTDEHNDWLAPPPADHPPARLHREALLPARMGRQLARAFHRRPHQRLPRPRTEVRRPKLVGNYLRVGYDPRRLLAHLQAAPGFPSRREGADGGRHHRLGRAAARRA